MPVCMECGKGIEPTQWNAWNIFHLCEECEERLRYEARCPYCNKEFLHLRALEYRIHMEICKKEKE